MQKTKFVALIEPLFAIVAGLCGSVMAALQPWQEQIEWGGRMVLLLLSMASVIVGIFVARKRLLSDK